MAQIINNLPKGNVKAPQGAKMRISDSVTQNSIDFNNDTEFDIVFTPENQGQNGKPIYVENKIVNEEIIIGSQVGSTSYLNIVYQSHDEQYSFGSIPSVAWFYITNINISWFENIKRNNAQVYAMTSNKEEMELRETDNYIGLKIKNSSITMSEQLIPCEIFCMKKEMTFTDSLDPLRKIIFSPGCCYLTTYHTLNYPYESYDPLTLTYQYTSSEPSKKYEYLSFDNEIKVNKVDETTNTTFSYLQNGWEIVGKIHRSREGSLTTQHNIYMLNGSMIMFGAENANAGGTSNNYFSPTDTVSIVELDQKVGKICPIWVSIFSDNFTADGRVLPTEITIAKEASYFVFYPFIA